MKKLTKFIVLLSVFGLGVAGCDLGKKQDESPKESQTPSTEQQVSSDETKSSDEKSTEEVVSQSSEESSSIDEPSSELVVDQDLIDAAQYLYQLYKDVDASLEDFDLIGTVLDHTVTYKLEVLSGLDNVIVLGELGDNGKYHVTVHYNVEEATQDTTYRLTATVHSNSSDETVEYTFERVVPQFVLTTYDEYLKAIEDGKTDVLNLKAYVVARIAKGSSSFGSIYLQDADGHGYYVYAPAVADELKASDETYAAAFPDGAEVLVSGQAVLYNGQFEFNKGASIKTTGKTAADNNVTLSHTNVSAFMEAAESNSNKNNIYGDALHEYQNALVTIEGAKLLNPDGAYYYFTVGDGTAKFNLYDTYYFMTEEERNALKAKWTAGYTATITGILTVYSYGYQIYPLSQDAVVITDTTMSAEDTANVFFDAVALPANIVDLTVELPTAEGVAWTLDEGDNVASLEGNVLTLNPVAEDVNIKLTAVYTIDGEEFTRSFEAVVKALKAGPGSAADPFTVEEAIASMAGWESKQFGEDVVYVGGVVSSASYSTKYSNYTIWLRNGETEQGFELYGANIPAELGDFTANAESLVGKYVVAKGYQQLYNTTYELSKKDGVSPEIVEIVDPAVGNGSHEMPYSAAAVLNVMANYEKGQISENPVAVKGEVTSATYNSKYSSYTIWLKNGENAQAFQLYSVGMAEGLDYSADPSALVGKIVSCEGYLKLYNTTYEMCFLKAAESPTGADNTPVIFAVNEPESYTPVAKLGDIKLELVDNLYVSEPTEFRQWGRLTLTYMNEKGETVDVTDPADAEHLANFTGLYADYNSTKAFYPDAGSGGTPGVYTLAAGKFVFTYNAETNTIDIQQYFDPGVAISGAVNASMTLNTKTGLFESEPLEYKQWNSFVVTYTNEKGETLVVTNPDDAEHFASFTGLYATSCDGTAFYLEAGEGGNHGVYCYVADTYVFTYNPETNVVDIQKYVAPVIDPNAQATVTVETSSFTEMASAAAYNVVVDGVTVAVSNGLVSATDGHFRIYKNQTLTLSAEQKITKVVFTCVTDYGKGAKGFADHEGLTFSEDTWTGTWEGEATELVLTASNNQVRIVSIVVTLG